MEGRCGGGRRKGDGRKGCTPVWELGMLGMAVWLGTRDGERGAVEGLYGRTHSEQFGSRRERFLVTYFVNVRR